MQCVTMCGTVITAFCIQRPGLGTSFKRFQEKKAFVNLTNLFTIFRNGKRCFRAVRVLRSASVGTLGQPSNSYITTLPASSERTL